MSITLAQLRTAARQRADMENSDFVTDSELNGYINSEIAELHDLLIQSYGADYFVSSATFSTVAGTDSYAISSNVSSSFYKLKGVDILLNGDWYSAAPFNWNERNRFNDSSWGTVAGPNVRYRMVGGNLIFTPAPTGVYSVKVWYVPVATKLTSDSDSYDDLNQYFEYVVTGAAIKCLLKEESDVSALAAMKLDLRKRIIDSAANRDVDKSESIADIHAENDDFWLHRG